MLELHSRARYLHRRVGAKLASRIENPSGSQPAERNALSRLANRGEIRFHVLHAAKHHAHRNRDLRVDHVLPHQLFAEVPCDQSVVVRIAQEGSDPLERFDESQKIRIVVARDNFFPRQRNAVPRRQFDGSVRPNRSFQMQMQFRFRKGIDDRGLSSGLRHEFDFIG
jgi:hypothetical protein